MALGKKTGGRVKGTPNKDNPLKGYLRAHSLAYFEPCVTIDDPELAHSLHIPVGTVLSRFDLDLAAMKPDERAAIEERLLRYHTPQMQAVSADLTLSSEDAGLEMRLARLAETDDTPPP